MTRIICLVLLVLGIQSIGKCDTITNWQVYHNEKLIAELNWYNSGYTIIINKNNLKIGDTITVDYFKDTPCFDCVTFLAVEDSKDTTIAEWKGLGTFTPKKIPVANLLLSGLENFEIWYHEGDLSSKIERELLFKIKLE
ncbi:MAG: hypothetical protein AB8B72_13785 [Crocinitomicaceae bacterium]